MPRLSCLALAAALITAAPALQAAMYKWTDADGNVTYSQTPPPDGAYENIRVPRGPAAAPPSTQPDTQAPTGGAGIDAISAESAEIRQRNCEGARSNLQTYQVHRRIRNAEGEVIVLDDAERQARIDEAKRHILEFCD